MAIDAGGMLTRKLGPLPAWGWGVAVGGAYLGVKMLRGGGGGFAGGQDAQIVQVPTGIIPVSPNFTDELSEAVFGLNRRIDELQQELNNNVDDGEQMPGPTPKPPTTTPPAKPPATAPQPATKPAGLSRAEAAAILRSKGLDPAKIIGYGVSGFSSWITSAAAKYVWKDEASFRAWVKRTFGK